MCMQNISEINTKIININSERLFREAEDDLFYFNNINSAYKKLKMAVKLTPNHFKSIMLLADTAFLKGYFKKAAGLYIKASNIQPYNFRTYACIVNCYKMLKNYKLALKYCDLAFACCLFENYSLYIQLLEIKIELLISQKMYKQASFDIIKLRKNVREFDFDYEFLHNKIVMHNKLIASNLKIV